MATKTAMEVSLSNPALAGYIEAEVYEVGGAAPTTIIDFDQDWGVKLKWDLTGSLRPFVCGTWCISLFFESIGDGPEFDLRHDHRIPLDPCGNGHYEYDFRVRRGTVKKEHCGRPYKLVVAVVYETACHRPGPMAGFVELPMIQFYDSITI